MKNPPGCAAEALAEKEFGPSATEVPFPTLLEKKRLREREKMCAGEGEEKTRTGEGGEKTGAKEKGKESSNGEKRSSSGEKRSSSSGKTKDAASEQRGDAVQKSEARFCTDARFCAEATSEARGGSGVFVQKNVLSPGNTSAAAAGGGSDNAARRIWEQWAALTARERRIREEALRVCG